MGFLNDPRRIPENYGIKTALGLIGYLLLIKLLDVVSGWELTHHVELRLLNLFILVGGIYFGLKKFKETHEAHMNYFRGLIVGTTIGAIGSVLFAVFLFIYMKIDHSLIAAIQENEPMGHYLNEYISAFIVALEGLFSGMLVTFLLMNYMDTDEVNQPAGESK